MKGRRLSRENASTKRSKCSRYVSFKSKYVNFHTSLTLHSCLKSGGSMFKAPNLYISFQNTFLSSYFIDLTWLNLPAN
jgi:hypothetical protein